MDLGLGLNGSGLNGSGFLFEDGFEDRDWNQPCEGGPVRNGNAFCIAFGTILFIMLTVYLLDRRWRLRQEDWEKETLKHKGSHEFTVDLVKRLMPTFATEKYQFRGMKAHGDAINIEFEGLNVELPNGKRVLEGVTGECNGGRLFAVMGPSGAGKTSFMNALSGRVTIGRVDGTISINGQTDKAAHEAFKRATGYVPQDDIVHEDLTIREQIEFSARLRGAVGISRRQVKRIVEDVLNIMGLLHVQNSIVGSVEQRGVSGGERKRVNIGLELAAQPAMLFLDEPTSGLDATSSVAVASSLKTMCGLGITSMMVIHQPRYSLFTLFDDVLLLGKGGKMVFLGPSLAVKPYFESLGYEAPANENPADWFMDVMCGEVKNKEKPEFTFEMLFGAWLTHSPDILSTSFRGFLQGGARTRFFTESDEQSVLAATLETQWDRIDVRGTGFMRVGELRKLLGSCAGTMPSEDATQDILNSMAGKGAEFVSKQRFIDHLCQLSQTTMWDTKTHSPKRKQGWPLAVLPTRISETIGGISEAIGAIAGATHTGDNLAAPEAEEEDFLQEVDMSIPQEPHTKAVLDRHRRGPAAVVHAEDSEASPRPTGGADSSCTPAASESTGASASFAGAVATGGPFDRRLPGFFSQLRTLTCRRLIQWWRMGRHRALFLIAVALGATVLAVLDLKVVPKEQWDAVPYIYTHTTLALLLSIFSLHVFGSNQLVFYRESTSGLNVFAFFQARVIVNTLDVILQCMMFTWIYFIIRRPCVPYWKFCVPFLFLGYGAASWGFLLSVLVPAKHGPFITALIMFVMSVILGEPMNLHTLLEGRNTMGYIITSASVVRWTAGMSFCILTDLMDPRTNPKLLFVEKDVYMRWGLPAGCFGTPVIAVVVMCIVLHSLTYTCLRWRIRCC